MSSGDDTFDWRGAYARYESGAPEGASEPEPEVEVESRPEVGTVEVPDTAEELDGPADGADEVDPLADVAVERPAGGRAEFMRRLAAIPRTDPEEIERLHRGGKPLRTRIDKMLYWKPLAGSPEGGDPDDMLWEVDFERSLEDADGLPRFEVAAGQMLNSLWGHELKHVASSSGKKGGEFFVLWNGKVWVEEPEDKRPAGVVRVFWDVDYRECLRLLRQAVVERVEEVILEKIRSGMSPDDAKASAVAEVGDPMRKRLVPYEKFFEKIGSDNGQSALLRQFRKSVDTLSEESFDEADEYRSVLVCENGVLDFRQVEQSVRDGAFRVDLQEHSPHRRVKMLAPVEWAGVEAWGSVPPESGLRGAVPGGLFARYLEAVLPDPRLRRYLQQALGMGLLGDPQDKVIINLVGPGNTGKSQFLAMLANVFGPYVAQPDVKIFMERRHGGGGGEGPQPELHKMRAARFVVASEPSAGAVWDGGELKRLTGKEDAISTRDLHQKGKVTWKPRFVMMVATNHFVRLDTRDSALVHRIGPVGFRTVFYTPSAVGPYRTVEEIETAVGAERIADPNLMRRFAQSAAERSGLLGWLVEGLRQRLEIGALIEPEALSLERSAMVEDISTAIRWARDAEGAGLIVTCPPGLAPGDWTDYPQQARLSTAEAHAMYEEWCDEEGIPAGQRKGQDNFSKDLGSGATTFGEVAQRALRIKLPDGVTTKVDNSRVFTRAAIPGRTVEDYRGRWLMAKGYVSATEVGRMADGAGGTMPMPDVFRPDSG